MQIQNNNNQNTNFNGRLYSQIGNHLTKPIYCCHHGDKKFIRYINEIAAKNINSFEVKISNSMSKSFEVKTSKIPKLTFWEKLRFIVTPIQNKALKMREQGKIKSFIYKISEAEYQKIKREAGSALKHELKIFEQNIRQKTSGAELKNIEKIIY